MRFEEKGLHFSSLFICLSPPLLKNTSKTKGWIDATQRRFYISNSAVILGEYPLSCTQIRFNSNFVLFQYNRWNQSQQLPRVRDQDVPEKMRKNPFLKTANDCWMATCDRQRTAPARNQSPGCFASPCGLSTSPRSGFFCSFLLPVAPGGVGMGERAVTHEGWQWKWVRHRLGKPCKGTNRQGDALAEMCCPS